MIENLERFLKKRNKRITRLEPSPIILRWMKSPHMTKPLAIFDKHVEYLLNHGSTKKLEEWFLTGDQNFNAITAERYIIGYLRMKNANLVDNLSRSGIDAHLDNGNSPVGIEITTLNSFVASWIFVERLTNLLDKHGYLEDKEIDVTYSHGRLYAAMQGKTIYDYIASAGKAILTGDEHTISQLELSVEMNEELRGLISFHINDPDKVPWFEYITDGLASRLREKSKARQLKKYSRNLVFVGLNHLSPSNWAFPDVFEDLGTNVGRFSFETNAIKDYWALHLPNLPNIVGICYFFYSLDREDPFYPLKIFWRNDYDCIAINL